MRWHLLNRLALLSSLWFAGCDGSAAGFVVPDDTYRYFRVTAGGEAFVLRTADPQTWHVADSLLALPLSERNMLVIGPIEKGDEGYNRPWSWHFKTNEWIFAENAIELCDGTPSYVEEHLDEWLSSVGSYCPWSSRIEREFLTGETIWL